MGSLKSIEETLATFQKKMWSSDKPIVVCLDFFEELLLVQVRLQTVLRDSRKIISSVDDQRESIKYHMNSLSGLVTAI